MKKFHLFFLCAFLMFGFQSCDDLLDEFECEDSWEDCECPDDDHDDDWYDDDDYYDDWSYSDYDSMPDDSTYYDLDDNEFVKIEPLENGKYKITPILEFADWDVEVSLDNPSNGGEIGEKDGYFIYIPNNDFSGTEFITFVFTDEDGSEFEITIEINIGDTEPAVD